MDLSSHSKAVVIDALHTYKSVLEWEMREHYDEWRSGDRQMNHTTWIENNPRLVEQYKERQALWKKKIRETVNKIHTTANHLMDEL